MTRGARRPAAARARPRRAAGSLPCAVVADADGNVVERDDAGAAMRSGRDVLPLDPDDLIELPAGSTLYALPGRTPLAFTAERGLAPLESEEEGGAAPGAVAAFLPSGYSVFGLSAYERRNGAPLLPLFSYAAVCW